MQGEYISLVLWKAFTFPLLSKEKNSPWNIFFPLHCTASMRESLDEIFNEQKKNGTALGAISYGEGKR